MIFPEGYSWRRAAVAAEYKRSAMAKVDQYTCGSFRRVVLPDGFGRFCGNLSKNFVITEILKRQLFFKGCYCYNHSSGFGTCVQWLRTAAYQCRCRCGGVD